jgi:predicted AAA+ superfamily ATPase
LNYLKILVDKNRTHYGQWLLTGSQKFELMQSVGDSLAGRISIIHLETLSAMEIRGQAVDNQIDYIWKGGYPELWSNPALDSQSFFADYIQTYLERDLRQIINISNLVDFQRFIRVCAACIGQLINYRDIAKDVGVSDVTIKNWLNALEQSGIIYRLPPFYANMGKRFVKSPKLYFADQGLACYLLNVQDYSGWQSHIYKGNLWENVVFCELLKTGRYQPGKNLFFYRDQNGVEMDFLIEEDISGASPIILIEAKASEKTAKKKLNFSRIAPLFNKRPVKCLLMANISHRAPLKMKDYIFMNPVFCDIK